MLPDRQTLSNRYYWLFGPQPVPIFGDAMSNEKVGCGLALFCGGQDQLLSPSPEKNRCRQRQFKGCLRASCGRSQRKHAPGYGECRPKQTLEKTGDKKEDAGSNTDPEPDKGQYVDICEKSAGEYKLESLQDGLKSLSIGDSRPRTICPSIEEAFKSGEALTPPDIESFEDETDDYWTWDPETQQFKHWDEEDQEWVYFPEIFD